MIDIPSGTNSVEWSDVNARRLARQGRTPATAGTLPTHQVLFVGLLTAVVLVVVGLTYFPALSLGPLAEALS